MGKPKTKTEHWVHRSPALHDLPFMRDEIIADPGTDVEYSDMAELRDDDIDDCDALLAAHVDDTIASLTAAFSDGHATVYRAISIDDVAAFLNTVESRPLGSHWAIDPECATTGLHSGEYRDHDVLLAAIVTAEHVCWATTMQQRISHPCEMEVFIDGPVHLLHVTDMSTDDVFEINRACKA